MKSFIVHVSIALCLTVVVSNAKTASAGTYQVGVAPPTVKVMIQGGHEGWPFEGTISDHYDMYLARGEHEAMQVVVIATDALANVSVTVSHPQETPGAGALNGEANAWLVGHVDVHDWTGYSKDHHPTYMEGYNGWYPDPLLTFTNSCSSINAGDRVAFWIDVSVLREATAGDYVSTITVTADNSLTTNVQFNIHVWDFELPLKASLPTMFSMNEYLTGQNGGPRMVYGDADWYGMGIAQQFYDLLLDRRMGGMHLYKLPDEAEVESFANIVDWEARGCSDVNIKYLGKSNPAKTTDVTNNPALATLVSQLSTAGLLGMAYVYGYDESTAWSAIYNMFSAVHNTFPGLRTMTTARDSSFGTSPTTSFLRPVVDIWVPQTDVYHDNNGQAAAAQLRAEGKDLWWYVCSGPWGDYANFFVEYSAIEARLLMGAMAYKYETGGFLYYNICKWPAYDVAVNPNSPLLEENDWMNVPITSGPYTAWYPLTNYTPANWKGNNGDGSLFCAGPDGPIPTIRSDNIRDGLEDYEYFKLLESLIVAMSGISEPTPAQLAWISSAQQLLVVPSTIVSSMISFTRDTAALESYRQQMGEAIATGQYLLTPAPADHDADGDVDLADFGSFQACLAGSEIKQTDPACVWSDLNNDEYVDSADLSLFLGCISGPGITANTDCVQ